MALCEAAGLQFRFRDYLRSSADAPQAYAAAKHEAARIWRNDRAA